MLFCRNSYSTQNSVNKKEKFLFVFTSEKQADFWFRETCEVFRREIVSVDYHKKRVDFLDSTFYFTPEIMEHKIHIRQDFTWGVNELYIILDDPGRMYLDTYIDGGEPEK